MATYILQGGLKRVGANASTKIPDRMKDGYGINEHLIEQAKEDIRYRNERDEEYRNKEIERQNWFKEHAPAYIESVKQKQQELAEYFISLGYTKESNC